MRASVTKFNLFGDNVKESFIGVLVDEASKTVNLYFRCSLFSRFEEMKRQLDEWNANGVQKQQDELSTFVKDMGACIADERDKKRFVIGSSKHSFKNPVADITHVFPEHDGLTMTHISAQSPNGLHMASIIYFNLLQLANPLKNIDTFVEALKVLQAEHVVKMPIRVIEEFNFVEGFGYIY